MLQGHLTSCVNLITQLVRGIYLIRPQARTIEHVKSAKSFDEFLKTLRMVLQK